MFSIILSYVNKNNYYHCKFPEHIYFPPSTKKNLLIHYELIYML